MKDKKFRNLLGEYMEEISDPKNRAVRCDNILLFLGI
jgi:hypothetical protein